MKYKVYVVRKVLEDCVVDVEARNKFEAEMKAMRIAEESGMWQDYRGADIYVAEVEEEIGP